MADKLSPKKTALSLAIVSSIFYTACALLFAFFPMAGIKIASYLFHGIDIAEVAIGNSNISNILLGLVETFIGAFALGWLFAVIYNKV